MFTGGWGGEEAGAEPARAGARADSSPSGYQLVPSGLFLSELLSLGGSCLFICSAESKRTTDWLDR
jgi:hypothetical protein